MIVIPMAGVSRRFVEAGYHVPKYMLSAGKQSLFAHSVGSFARYFSSVPFLFIYRDVSGTDRFVRAEVEKLGIRRAEFVLLDSTTGGQAETVSLGLGLSSLAMESDELTIFNIDTIRRDFAFPALGNSYSGFLEVFHGEGTNWSFVQPMPNHPDLVLRTTEKEPISHLCSTGLYHFSRQRDFQQAFESARRDDERNKGEYYVAPLYNKLIAAGLPITYVVVSRDAVELSGTPAEYVAFAKKLTDD